MRNVFQLAADAVVINAAIILAFILKFGLAIPEENFIAYKVVALPATLIFIGLYYVYELYSKNRIFTAWEIAARAISASFVGILALVTLSFAFRSFSFPRIVILLSWILITCAFISWRIFVSKYLPNCISHKNILFVGINPQFARIANNINGGKGRERVVGFIENDDALRFSLPFLGPMKKLNKIIVDNRINHIIVTSPSLYREFLDTLASVSIDADVKIDIVPDIYEILIGRMEYSLLSDVPLVTITKDPVPPWIIKLKRLFDVVFGSLLLVLLLPLMLLIAIIIKTSSRGKVFYTQQRVGRGERLFNLVKFRSMVENAEAQTGPVMASSRDTRITSIGRFLRRWRLDEFPQLINIIKGEMSFVGPRPERPFFVDQYKEAVAGYEKRFAVKPGLTGLSQVSGFYNTSAENKLKYDLIYVSHQSLMLDFQIILQTLRVVLEGKGVK